MCPTTCTAAPTRRWGFRSALSAPAAACRSARAAFDRAACLAGGGTGPVGRVAQQLGRQRQRLRRGWRAQQLQQGAQTGGRFINACPEPGQPAALLVPHGIRLGACWDLAAVHRVIHGGWRVDEVRIWCAARGLDRRNAPVSGQLDLGSGDAGDGPHPAVRADGHLRAEWVEGAWRDRAAAAAQWAELALQVQQWQVDRLAGLPAAGDAMSLARSESAAEIICAELEHDGLPIDLAVADELITSMAGARPTSEAEANRRRAERDAEVLRHLPDGPAVDLRNPADVKAMLRRVGIDVPDTRAWRLEAMREVQLAMLANPRTAHPNLWASFIVSGDWRPMEVPVKLPAGKVAPGVRGCGCEVAGEGRRAPAAWAAAALGLAAAMRRRRRRPEA